MKKFVSWIPNAITSCNLLCGCFAVVAAMSGRLDCAAYCIFAAAVFDFFDGFAARALHVRSAIGKELDSLADVVSFGVAPACIIYALLLKATDNNLFMSLPAFLIAVFSALRLAKFNLDERQTDTFIGLPTPANALFICALAFIAGGNGFMSEFTGSVYFLWADIAVFSLLLVAELPLFSLKFKSFGWKGNETRYIFMALSLCLLLLFRWEGLALVILLYIALSTCVRLLKPLKS